MNYIGQIAMSFQDADGNYFSAVQNYDASWNVSAAGTLTFVQSLPKGWDNTGIVWQRDPNYLGVFRSMSSDSTYQFIKDGRAIIKYIRATAGVQSFLKLNIYIWNEATFNYDVLYTSSIDFTTYSDSIQTEMLSIGTLDCDLIRDIHAYGNTAYNIPVWVSNGGGGWDFNADAWINHKGIKVLYNSIYVAGGAPLNVNTNGFNLGKHDATSANKGFHFIPPFATYNPVQNNGATTYIGNTILQTQLLQSNQNAGANGESEINFGDVNDSQPYTRNNFSLKNAIPNATTGISMLASVSGTFVGDITVLLGSGSTIDLSFVLFEVGPQDQVTTNPLDSSEFSPIVIQTISFQIDGAHNYTPLPASFSNYVGGVVPNFTGHLPANPTTIAINPDKVYIFAIIWDQAGGGTQNTPMTCAINNLQFSIYSYYDYGASGTPIPAPSLNPSPIAGFRLSSLFEKVILNLPTLDTDLYGYPIPVNTDYAIKSDYLLPTQPAIFDCVPYQLLISSASTIHNLQGQIYVTISLNQLFNLFQKVLGGGASIEYDANGNPTIFRLEKLDYFFDNTTEILDLGFDIFGLTVEPMIDKLGANLKAGYTKADTNSNFGVDSFNTELYFDTPLSMMPGTIDLEETDIQTDQYPIEITREQQANAPVGTSFDPANPSSDNQASAFYVLPEHAVGTIEVFDPKNNPVTTGYFELSQRDGVNLPAAQNNDPSAAIQPYINGLYYPDTAYNLEISPKRNLMRIGNLLHSWIDDLESANLAFRNTGILEIVNMDLLSVGLAGIESNLNVGSGAGDVINEFSSVKIGDLPPQLFKPYILKFTSRYPVNMYQLIKSNPRGYIKFSTEDVAGNVKVWKGFINRVEQIPGTQMVTDFELLATPDMVI